MKWNSCLLLFIAFISPGYSQNAGHITYTLNQVTNPTEDQRDAYAKIKVAMDSGIVLYNKYTSQTKHIQVHYNTGVPTAEASFNGTLSFGANRSYMLVGTAMHEIAHTLGIGTTTEYKALIQNGVFTGQVATEALRLITNDQTALPHGDAQHFWPYGINYASEVKSEKDLIDHCKMVEAITKDMFHEVAFFTGRIRSVDSKKCMVRSGSALSLGACTDSSSEIRVIRMGQTSFQYRMYFGNLVLDIPNESKAEGIVLGLYSWIGGAHQKFTMEAQTSTGENIFRLRMVNSGLYLMAEDTKVMQVSPSVSPQLQAWELLEIGSIPSSTKNALHQTRQKCYPHKSFDLIGRSR